MKRRADQLRPGDAVERVTGRLARVLTVTHRPEPLDGCTDGVWLTWSDGLGPYVTTPDYEIHLAPVVIDHDRTTGT